MKIGMDSVLKYATALFFIGVILVALGVIKLPGEDKFQGVPVPPPEQAAQDFQQSSENIANIVNLCKGYSPSEFQQLVSERLLNIAKKQFDETGQIPYFSIEDIDQIVIELCGVPLTDKQKEELKFNLEKLNLDIRNLILSNAVECTSDEDCKEGEVCKEFKCVSSEQEIQPPVVIPEIETTLIKPLVFSDPKKSFAELTLPWAVIPVDKSKLEEPEKYSVENFSFSLINNSGYEIGFDNFFIAEIPESEKVIEDGKLVERPKLRLKLNIEDKSMWRTFASGGPRIDAEIVVKYNPELFSEAQPYLDKLVKDFSIPVTIYNEYGVIVFAKKLRETKTGTVSEIETITERSEAWDYLEVEDPADIQTLKYYLDQIYTIDNTSLENIPTSRESGHMFSYLVLVYNESVPDTVFPTKLSNWEPEQASGYMLANFKGTDDVLSRIGSSSNDVSTNVAVSRLPVKKLNDVAEAFYGKTQDSDGKTAIFSSQVYESMGGVEKLADVYGLLSPEAVSYDTARMTEAAVEEYAPFKAFMIAGNCDSKGIAFEDSKGTLNYYSAEDVPDLSEKQSSKSEEIDVTECFNSGDELFLRISNPVISGWSKESDGTKSMPGGELPSVIFAPDRKVFFEQGSAVLWCGKGPVKILPKIRALNFYKLVPEKLVSSGDELIYKFSKPETLEAEKIVVNAEHIADSFSPIVLLDACPQSAGIAKQFSINGAASVIQFSDKNKFAPRTSGYLSSKELSVGHSVIEFNARNTTEFLTLYGFPDTWWSALGSSDKPAEASVYVNYEQQQAENPYYAVLSVVPVKDGEELDYDDYLPVSELDESVGVISQKAYDSALSLRMSARIMKKIEGGEDVDVTGKVKDIKWRWYFASWKSENAEPEVLIQKLSEYGASVGREWHLSVTADFKDEKGVASAQDTESYCLLSCGPDPTVYLRIFQKPAGNPVLIEDKDVTLSMWVKLFDRKDGNSNMAWENNSSLHYRCKNS